MTHTEYRAGDGLDFGEFVGTSDGPYSVTQDPGLTRREARIATAAAKAQAAITRAEVLKEIDAAAYRIGDGFRVEYREPDGWPEDMSAPYWFIGRDEIDGLIAAYGGTFTAALLQAASTKGED